MSKMTKKNNVVYVTDREEVYFNYCTIDEAIAELQEVKERLGAEATVYLNAYESYGDPSGHIEVYRQRPENEQEKVARLAREKRAEDYERQQYEALKKKYG